MQNFDHKEARKQFLLYAEQDYSKSRGSGNGDLDR